jgi:two-component system cell cycle response regulator DivK
VIVALTAFSMPNDRQNVLTAGFDGYMSKPIDPEQFVAEVECWLPAALRLPVAP